MIGSPSNIHGFRVRSIKIEFGLKQNIIRERRQPSHQIHLFHSWLEQYKPAAQGLFFWELHHE